MKKPSYGGKNKMTVARVLRSLTMVAVFIDQGDLEYAFQFQIATRKLVAWWNPYNPKAEQVARKAAFPEVKAVAA